MDHLPAVCCRDHAAMAALPVIRKNGDDRVAAYAARLRVEFELNLLLMNGNGQRAFDEAVAACDEEIYEEIDEPEVPSGGPD